MPIIKGESVEVQTSLGTLRAEVHADPAYPGLTIYWGNRQIAIVESAAPMMRVYVWDTDNEDPSAVLPVFPGYGEVQCP